MIQLFDVLGIRKDVTFIVNGSEDFGPCSRCFHRHGSVSYPRSALDLTTGSQSFTTRYMYVNNTTYRRLTPSKTSKRDPVFLPIFLFRWWTMTSTPTTFSVEEIT